MKKNINRFLSLLLAASMLLSTVPAVATAEGSTPSQDTPVTVVYDFAVKNSQMVDANNKTLATGILSYNNIKNALNGYYEAGELNWNFAANNASLLQTTTNTVFDACYFGGTSGSTSYAWDGLRTGFHVRENNVGDYVAGYWVAFTIRVDTAGTYDLTLNYQTRGDGAKVGNVYLLSGAYTEPADIDVALTSDNLLKGVDFVSSALTTKSASLGAKQLAQGEYTLVFKAAEKKTGSYAAYMFLSNVTMVRRNDGAPILITEKYNFALETTDLKYDTTKSFGGAPLKASNSVKSAIEAYYTGKNMNWKYQLDNLDDFRDGTNTVNSTFLFGAGGNPWTGLRLGMNVKPTPEVTGTYPPGYYAAFVIRVPAAAEYQISLQHMTRADGTAKGEVYLLPGTYGDQAVVDAAMSSQTLLGSVNCFKNTWTVANANAVLGRKTLEQGEYTLVLKGAAYNKEENGTAAYFYAQGLTLQEVSENDPLPGETTEATTEATTTPTTGGDVQLPEAAPQGYNFALGGTDLVTANGGDIAGGTLTNAPVKSAIDAYYAKGTLDWKYSLDNLESFKTDTNTVSNTFFFGGGIYPWTGLRLGVNVRDENSNTYPAGYWVAMTLRSPGKGKYQLTMNYQTRADGTEAAEVYLLSGTYATADAAEKAMKKAKPLATVNFKSTSWTMEDNSMELGMVNMKKGEYTLILKATKGTDAGGYCYLNGLEIVHENDIPAPPPPPELGTGRYNFALGGTDLVTANGGDIAGARLTDDPARKAINAYYAQGTLDWKYSLDNLESFKTDTNTVSNTFFFGGGIYPWTGLRLGVNVRDENSNTYPAGYWVGMTLRSPGKGKYQITLNYQTRADGTEAAEVYLLSGTYATMAAAEKAMKKAKPLATVNFKSTSWTMEDNSMELGMVNMKKGEYTLIFKATKCTEAGGYCYINNLEIIHEKDVPAPPPPPQLDTGRYNFVLEDTKLVYSGDKSFDAAVYTNPAVQASLEKYYKNGELNWKPHSSYIPKGSTGNGAMFGGTADGKTYSWNGLRFYSMGAGGTPMWHAFTIQSPGTGTYYPSFTYMRNIMGASKGHIYLLPGNTKDVNAAIKKGKAIAEVNYDNRTGGDAVKETEVYYDMPLKLKAGEEYILVFTAEEPGTKTGENKFAYLYLNEFVLYSKKTLPDPGPNVVTYDFDVTDRANGIYTDGKVEMEDIKGDIAKRYAKGEIAWKLEDKASTMIYDVVFVNYAGMTSYSYEDDWMAFRCKAPGDGIYTLTMNYATGANGGLGAVYILPGSTKDVEKAMDHSNRLKKVAFYNETGESATEDGSVVTLGTWDFTGEDEFIIVFEAYDNSPFSNFAYMWVSQIIATEGNHVKQQESVRRISSITVKEGPVKTFEVTQYGTTSIVNGQNYLFIALEGNKMAIYNLDDMTKVKTVTTPFTVCRGMTTDSEGMIWLVGDKPVVYRYDPVSEVGVTTRNFGAEIPGCYGGFSCTTDENGVLYFGSYQRGAVVKYIPKTDTFVNMGEYNPDCGYSCGAIIKGDYLYIGITGDRNGDGVRTSEMLKINKETNECVDRVDITKQVGQNEVMVRGCGIGGDTLFVGGSQFEEFVAIDINTMELKDYGITKPIVYCGTEEYNGKIYFTLLSQGLHEYDIATDTVTNLKMETATSPVRCGEHSFVELHDPMYPGKTIVTYSGGAILLYNPEAKRSSYLDLFDEEADGSGTVCQPVVKGPKGTNTLYLGAFNTKNCAKYNILTDETTNFEAVGAQTDALCWYDGVLYTGNYTNGAITRINFEDPKLNTILLSMNNDQYEQNRVHALIAGDGKIFAGTMPRTDTYGGVLAVIDLETLESKVIRDIVKGQSVTGLVYHDGLVFGTTSISGGTGTEGPAFEGASAKIFVYDVAKEKKVAELDLRKHISGLPDILPDIAALEADPNVDENGRFWGMISETLFTFTFDKKTGQFSVKEFLSFAKDDFKGLNSHYAAKSGMDFKDGYLYVFTGNKGGMQKINMENPSDRVRLNCPKVRSFVIAEDGDLYFVTGGNYLAMYPLDVTNKDWQEAEKVDALIKAIGGPITLQHEAAIDKARAAYDALSWRHRALVQNYDILQIAETDLLECKIASIGEVTLDSQALIMELLDVYNKLPVKEQKYVKNYSKLIEAKAALTDILNKEAAAKVQALIDSIKDLGEITLEDEEAIAAIRAAYDELNFVQKNLVDATLLLQAEETIYQLRQEIVKKLIKMIASIGEVTLEDEALIQEAMEIFNWLNLDEREQVDFETLTAANRALIVLQKEAAAKVDALILAIGDSVDYFDRQRIQDAREAFDALTPGSQKYVQYLAVLEQAEQIYAAMFPLGALIAIVVVGVGAAATAAVILLRRRKRSAVPVAEKTAEDTPAESEETSAAEE